MTYLLAVVAGIAGAAVGWAAVAAAVVLVGSLLGASNFEGALGMFAVFGAGPIGGVVGLVLGIWLALRRRGHASVSALAWRLPAVAAAIAALAAGTVWYLYETRPGLGTSAGGAPRLDFEIRLPPGVEGSALSRNARIELNTERNRMPGQLAAGGGRREGERHVIAGTVELHYRSGWRLLELLAGPGEPSRVFDLRLPARPGHMREFGPWRRVDFIATGSEQPRPAPASEAFEIRTRVVYRDAEHAEESARRPK
jgi:hypothetical protein